MAKGAQGAVDMRLLPAAMAIVAGQRTSAVEAVLLVGKAVRFSGPGLDGPADHAAGECIANRFEFAHHLPPRHHHTLALWRGSRGDASPFPAWQDEWASLAAASTRRTGRIAA